MFDNLKRFLAEMTGAGTVRPFADDDYRLAAVALLIHVARADGVHDARERSHIAAVVERRFGLDGQAAAQLLAAAEESDREAVDFFHFTSLLKRRLDDEGRHKIIEMMWDVAYADGTVHEFEENIVSRIAELLGVSPRDRVILKHKVAQAATSVAGTPSVGVGPWERTAPDGVT